MKKQDKRILPKHLAGKFQVNKFQDNKALGDELFDNHFAIIADETGRIEAVRGILGDVVSN